MEIVGRVIGKAEIKKLKDEREFVAFSIAVNDFYKQKNAEKGTQTVLYIDCAYWLNTAVSERLTKGSIVELNGRLYLNAYTSHDGEAKATLNCHVNTIKVHHSLKQADAKLKEEKESAPSDVPF
jgi:single-strand DNA-binding protein